MRLRVKNRSITIMGWVVQVSNLSLILIPAIMNAHQVALNLLESFIENHFQVCSIDETFMEKIRKSKSFMVGPNGKIILSEKLGKRIDEKAKHALIEIVDISQELREETGVPAEIFTMRLFKLHDYSNKDI